MSLPEVVQRTVQSSKTVATRLAPEEVVEVEAAAKRAGKSLAEWLRETVLREARTRPADPVELLLGEVLATRYLVLNCLHATAQAAVEGRTLLPEAVLKIRDVVDSQKAQKARKLFEEFSQKRQNSGKV
jgi:hypothetical protein